MRETVASSISQAIIHSVHLFVPSFLHSFFHSVTHSEQNPYATRSIRADASASFSWDRSFIPFHSMSFPFIHSFILYFISFHSFFHSFISFHFMSCHFMSGIHSFIHFIRLFIPSFIAFSFMSCHFMSFHVISCQSSIHSFVYCGSFHFMSCHFKSFIFNSFTSFQLTKNCYKQSGSYSHVLFSKLPPRRVPGTT